VQILILPEYPYPTNHAVVETVYERLLPERGHVVHMIRPGLGVKQPEVREAPWGEGSLRLFPHEPLGSAASNILRRLRESRYLDVMMREMEAVKIDAVLVRNDLLYVQRALRFCRRRSIPLLYQVSSPDAEFRIRRGRAAGAKGSYQLIRGQYDLRVRRRLCRKADVVLPISDAMRDYMVDTEKLDPARVFSFPMGCSNGALSPIEQIATIKRQLNLPEGKTIVYSGVIDPVRDPGFMLDVLETVQKTLPEAVLLILTHITDDRRRSLERQAAGRRLPVKFVGPLHHSEVSLYLRSSDVMISPYPPMFEHSVCSPTKSLEALGVGLPVVGSAEVADHVEVFQRSGGGIATATNVPAFAGAIVSLLSDADKRRMMGEQGRRWVLAHRTYGTLTAYLESIMQNARSREALKELPHSNDTSRETEAECLDQWATG